jgi:hypothetical protein
MLILILILTLTSALYASTRTHGYVYEDAAWRATMQPTLRPQANLARWSFNAQMAQGHGAGAFHLGNVAIHLLNGVLVWALARRVRLGAAALLAAFIFLVHPIQREAVNYLSGRPDLLSTACGLLTILATIAALRATTRGPALGWLFFAAGCGALAFLTKPSAVALLGLVLITAAILERRTREVSALLWTLLVVGTVAAIVWVPVPQALFFTPEAGAWLAYAGRQAVALGRLLALVVVPVGFSIDHDYAWVTPFLGLLALALVGAAAWGSWALRRRRPVLAWAGLWVLVAVAPRFLTLGAYPGAGPELNEHQAYLSMVGVSIGLATFLKGGL